MATAFPYSAGYFYDDVMRNGSIACNSVKMCVQMCEVCVHDVHTVWHTHSLLGVP